MNGTKESLTSEICSHTGFTRADVKATIEGFFQAVESALKDGKAVQLRGSFPLEPVRRAAKLARNPKNNQAVMVPVRTGVRFRPAPCLSQAVQAMAEASTGEIVEAMARRRE